MLNQLSKWIKFKRIRNTKGTAFLSRLTIYFKKGSLKLHLITGDDSPEYHNHPWDFTSLILFGGYKEWLQYNSNDEILYRYKTWKGVRDTTSQYFNTDSRIDPKVRIMHHRRAFSLLKRNHNQEHRVELFKLFGYKIPAITIGWYSHKIQLCSFCQKAGYCLQSKQH